MLWKTTALIVTLAIAPNAAAQVFTPPAVPGNLEVPDGNPYLMARAEGTQNYVCLPTSSGYTWTFFGPQATLFGDGGQQVTTHFLSPTPLRVALRVPRGSTRATPAPSGPRQSQTPLTPASSRRVRFPGSCCESLAVRGWAGR